MRVREDTVLDVQSPMSPSDALPRSRPPLTCGRDGLGLDGLSTPIGREQDLRHIRGVLASRQGSALLLVGDLGVGTTTLLDATVRHATRTGFSVARFHGLESEAGSAFAGAGRLLRTLGSSHGGATVEPCLSRIPGADDDDHGLIEMSEAMLSVLHALGERRPLLVVVDGLQWLDQSSVSVLGLVARRLERSRAKLVMGLRAGVIDPFEREAVPTRDVRPLNREESMAVLDRGPFALAQSVRDRIVREAKGNPLALVGLPACLSDAQRAGTTALPHVLPVDAALCRHLVQPLAGLSETTRELLLLAALGTSMRHGQFRVRGRTELEALGPAEHRHLVAVNSDGSLEFEHPLLRAAVLGSATASERQRAHALLAERTTTRAELRVWHLAQTLDVADEDVAVRLDAAADHLRGLGDAVGSIELLVQAIALSTSHAARVRRSAKAAYLSADCVGDLQASSRLLHDARVDHTVEGSLPAATAVACMELHEDGDFGSAHRLLTTAIGFAVLQRESSRGDLREAIHTLAATCVQGGVPEAWTAFNRQIAEVVPAFSPISSLMRAIGDPAHCADADLATLDVSLAAMADEPDPAEVVRVAAAGTYLDRLSDHRSDLARAVRQASADGSFVTEMKGLHLLAFDAFAIGDWAWADELCAKGLGLGVTLGYQLDAHLLLHVRALIAAARGEFAAAAQLADELARWAAPRQLAHLLDCSAQVSCLVAMGRSDFELAHREAATINAAGRLDPHVPVALSVLLDLVEASVRTDRHAQAAAHVAAMRDAGLVFVSPRLAMIAAASEALVEDGDRGLALFDEALSVPGGDRWPFDRARVQLLYGERLRRGRATTEARVQLAVAEATFERLGARPWALRAGTELRAAGQRITPAEIGELTAQEREVAMLAAAGLSNKQIAAKLLMSHRTVGAHLYRVFPKLGVTRRAALRDALESLAGLGYENLSADVG